MSERPTRKAKRRPRRGSRAIDASCRNHGSCGWCRGNRTVGNKRLHDAVQAQERER